MNRMTSLLKAAATFSFVIGAAVAVAQGSGSGGGASGSPSNNPPGTNTNSAGNPKPGGPVPAASGMRDSGKTATPPRRAASASMGASGMVNGKVPPATK